ncbi:hypothetical protein BVX97_06065, partial [bacterium E08(2017)]
MDSASRRGLINQDILLYTVSEEWNESAATWFARTPRVGTPSENWTTAGGSYHTNILWRTHVSNVIAAAGQWISIDVPASIIEGWLADPTCNHGFFFRPENDKGGGMANNAKDDIKFASSENGTTANRPILEINYSSPGGNLLPSFSFETSPEGVVDLGTDINM